MVRSLEGSLEGHGLRIAVIQSRFNAVVCDRLSSAAVKSLTNLGVTDITLVKVPGAFEIPQAAGVMAATGEYDAIVCLGAVVRGETPHFDYVAGESARGATDVAREHGIPVVFGVLTTDTMEQALARSGGPAGDKGAEAASVAVEMAQLFRKIRG